MISIKKYNIRQLKRKFENRDFAIPEIQRQYVWKKPQILKLMDSIFKNYPIGIGLVWYAPFSKAIHIRPNNKTIVPPFNKKSKHAELIIDGQQRLSTLYGIFMGVEERPEAGSDRSPRASSKTRRRRQLPRTRPKGSPAPARTRASIGNGRFAA